MMIEEIAHQFQQSFESHHASHNTNMAASLSLVDLFENLGFHIVADDPNVRSLAEKISPELLRRWGT